ncbi:plasmid recombination enzyme [Roseinatronobacter thiooxidans]|uniref:Plasmid recombination enzyme n=1 Tax=Roseinatronobacter thiooxidans TaxID=121821 RepID=A0A2W7PLL8_9RHOB|nr:plasmid recombination protein [Roseinatronobacter thiooxidans]PZX36233.1 plasmid recombination enzyme [Roseinatronobacter thiooxidans]
MLEIVFIHCQTYCRKPNRVGQCVKQVIGEGLRSGGYHSHVENPKPPVPVFGDPGGFQKLHDDHVAARRTSVVKNGRVSERAIRTDRHTLLTIVASYPSLTFAVEASPEELTRFKRWVDLNLAWVRAQYGDQLKVAFVHTDETYPHIHFWLLPDDPGVDAALLHPGKVAKRETEARLKEEGASPRGAVVAGNRALKQAMRSWIDDYHRAVGAPLGMHRDGPKRRRLSRAQWMAEQYMLDHHRQLEADRIRLEAHVTELEAKGVTIAAQQRELVMKAVAFVDRAEQHHRRMRAELDQVAALNPMLDSLVAELEDRTISIVPGGSLRVRDPSPFRAAGKVWVKLEPAVRRLVKMVQAAEDGRWNAGTIYPEYTPLPRPAPTACEASL